jgi:hypothetical protein
LTGRKTANIAVMGLRTDGMNMFDVRGSMLRAAIDTKHDMTGEEYDNISVLLPLQQLVVNCP